MSPIYKINNYLGHGSFKFETRAISKIPSFTDFRIFVIFSSILQLVIWTFLPIDLSQI